MPVTRCKMPVVFQGSSGLVAIHAKTMPADAAPHFDNGRIAHRRGLPPVACGEGTAKVHTGAGPVRVWKRATASSHSRALALRR